MTSAVDQARDAFMDGVALFEQHDHAAAEIAFQRALDLAPGRPSVLLNLGITKVHVQRFAQAIPLLHSALDADPAAADGWAALGLAQMELGQWGDALLSHDQAVAHGADGALIHLRHGMCLAHEGRTEAALTAFQAAVQRDATVAEAWSQQGHLWREAGQLGQAQHCYQTALELGGDPELHHYYLAALNPDQPAPQPPQRYVRTLFDEYARGFDDHLVEQLRYQGHRILVDQLPADCPAQLPHVLDVGCGTGLCGAAIRERAGRLDGVDLSPAMLDQARARRVYDTLHEADIVDYLAGSSEIYDLILVADVFIYIGPLEQVVALLAQRMACGAWLAVTLEEAQAGHSVQFMPSLRYAHSVDYLVGLASQHGLSCQKTYSTALRRDQQGAIEGVFLYFRRS